MAIEQKHFSKISQTVLKESLDLASFSVDGQQSKTQWDHALQIMKDSGSLTGDVQLVEGKDWTNEFIDKQALKHEGGPS
ncbi:MAG: hypothetical protein K6T31_04700 [Alicyclobacillus sp.]|nr:hypothetical protein [Alicyclobacillus sp.]